MGRVVEEFPEMENNDFSDLLLIYHVRDALTSAIATHGDQDNYNELVGYLQPKKHLNADEVALLVTTLNALSGAASYIDPRHHHALLNAVSRMSLWNCVPDVMDALIKLIISLAASDGKHMDGCLDMLVKNFVPPNNILDLLKKGIGLDKKNKVLSRVHAALKDIADLVPLAPLRLSPIVVQQMPVFCKEPAEIVMYVENMLKLESGAIGEMVGSTMLLALVDRMIELDVAIEWDGTLQEHAKGIFEMELEDLAEFEDNEEQYNGMLPAELVNRKRLQDYTVDEKLVVEKLDSLMVNTFLHLESSQSSGRLTEVFDVLLKSFQRTVLNAHRSKFTQFVMFYACSLDPEECGVKFAMVLTEMFVSDVNPPITRMSAVAYLASYLSRAKFISAALVASILQRLVDWCFNYCKLHDVDMNPWVHQVFYSGCQAVMYIMCFRMRSLMDVPRLKLQLQNMPIEPIMKHKLSPLKVCLPTVVEEFLRQAKAAQLFMTSDSHDVYDLLESDQSKAFGGMYRLDMFFPFDPCLLKKSESYIRPHFVRWSKVKTTYDDQEGNDSGSDVSDEDFVDMNAKDMIDDDIMVSVEEVVGIDFDPDLNRMSITPKNSMMHGPLRRLEQSNLMPARIRPSTSPESL